MTEQIGVGFIGAGANTKLRHLPGLLSLPGIRGVRVANRSEASSRAVAEAFEIEGIASGWEEIVSDPKIDAICIGTWPYMHEEITVAALENGKHVLTEARMASDLDGARRMLECSRRFPDKVAQIVPSPFTLDLDATVSSLLGSGRLGKILEVHIDHSTKANLDPQAKLNWRQDRRYSGINILTMGIYHEIIQRWFPDAMKVTSAKATTKTPRRVHWETGEEVEVEIPDILDLTGTMGGEALLNYHFSSVEQGPERNEIRLVGSIASLRVDVGLQSLFLKEETGREDAVEIPDSTRRGWRVEEDFIDSIRNGTPVRLTSFTEGVRYMEFTDAVQRHL